MAHQRRGEKMSKDERERESTEKKLPSSPPSTKRNVAFWTLLVFSQAVAALCIGLLLWWSTLYGGFGWEDAARQFFVHPLLMVIGLVIFYGDAILVFKVLHFLPKSKLKYIHAALHMLAIVLSSVGMVAIFENRRKTGKPEFYSLHSWLGIATFGLFCLQYIGSFITFLFPGLPTSIRTMIMPFHTFFGVGLFILSVASALLGLTERLISTEGYATNEFISEKISGNFLGLSMVTFAFLVVYLVTKSSYKRQPRKDEIPAHTN